MSRDGEEFQPGNGTGQRGQWQHPGEILVTFVMWLLVLWPLSMTYQPLWSQPAQRSLAYGAGMYTLGVIAALLLRAVVRVSLRPLKLVLASLLMALLAFPPLSGSISIAGGLLQLAGNRPESFVVMSLGLFLYILVYIPLALFLRQTMTHV